MGGAGGTATAQALDWTKDVDAQLAANDPRDADVLLAAECLWLRELVEPFADTVLELMRGARERRGVEMLCVLSFRDRSRREVGGGGGGGEGVFIGVKEIVDTFVGRGCGCRLLHRCPSTEDEGYYVSVFEITPPSSYS